MSPKDKDNKYKDSKENFHFVYLLAEILKIGKSGCCDGFTVEHLHVTTRTTRTFTKIK